MLTRRLTWQEWIAFTAMLASAGCSGDNGTAPSTASAIAPVSGNHQTGTVGQPLGQPLIVRVTDKNGAGVSGVAVSWAITAGGGALSATSSQTDAQGQTPVSWTLGTSAGSEKDTAFASVSGVNGTAVFTASASPGPAAQLTKLSGDGQTGGLGQALAQPVVVAASDQYGNLTSGVSVTWAVTAGGGSVSAASVMTDAQGQSAVSWTLGASAGANNDSAQASAPGLAGSPVTFTASASDAVVYTDTGAFRQATAGFGLPAIVNFEDADSTPVNNTIAGRTPFDGTHYAGLGFTFASPGGYALYIAPGGLFWNASNSLSIGHFPFDTTHAAPLNNADSLMITLSPGCRAVSFQLVDNGTRSPNEFVLFLDVNGTTVQQAGLPANYSSERAFIGLVSSTQVVTKILVAENANDGDDVDYDDFTCFHP